MSPHTQCLPALSHTWHPRAVQVLCRQCCWDPHAARGQWDLSMATTESHLAAHLTQRPHEHGRVAVHAHPDAVDKNLRRLRRTGKLSQIRWLQCSYFAAGKTESRAKRVKAAPL